MHVCIDGDLHTQWKDSHYGIDDHKPCTNIWTIANNYGGCPYMDVPQ